jgi:cell division inhibitor SepF
MAGALRKTMVYLGLSEEDQRQDRERYDDYESYDESDRYDDESRSERGGLADGSDHTAAVTQLPTRRPVAAVVRDPEVGSLNRITTIHPRTYNEAKNIGEWFRDNVPVIMNLSDMDDADAKRLVDFAAGLVFGLHGTIERVTSKVFLLSPSHVEIAADEPETPTVSTRGFFNQS